MNSGTNWARRQASQYRRLCARAGCSAPAVATLRFEPTQRHAWLFDLDETTARTQGDLCQRHAAALVLPRGWELHDDRVDRAARPVAEAPAADAPAPRRVRLRRRASGSASSAQPAPDQLPGFQPVVAATNGRRVTEEPDDEIYEQVPDERVPDVPLIEELVEEPFEAEAEPEPPDETEPRPAPAVAARTVPAQFGANDEDDEVDDDALNAVLDARTPLLQRAFRNAQPRGDPPR